jgi:hypothetical protein
MIDRDKLTKTIWLYNYMYSDNSVSRDMGSLCYNYTKKTHRETVWRNVNLGISQQPIRRIKEITLNKLKNYNFCGVEL